MCTPPLNTGSGHNVNVHYPTFPAPEILLFLIYSLPHSKRGISLMTSSRNRRPTQGIRLPPPNLFFDITPATLRLHMLLITQYQNGVRNTYTHCPALPIPNHRCTLTRTLRHSFISLPNSHQNSRPWRDKNFLLAHICFFRLPLAALPTSIQSYLSTYRTEFINTIFTPVPWAFSPPLFFFQTFVYTPYHLRTKVRYTPPRVISDFLSQYSSCMPQTFRCI